MDFWNIILKFSENELFIAVVGAILAAFLAFYFGLRSQKKVLREQNRLKMYEVFWLKRDQLTTSLIALTSRIRGFEIECILIASIERPEKAMDLDAWGEYRHRIYQSWTEYLDKLSEAGDGVSRSFVELHSLVEQSFFMFPELIQCFSLYKEEYQKLIDNQRKLVSYLYKIEPEDLADPEKVIKIQRQIAKIGTLDQAEDVIAYSMDLFSLIQFNMVGKIFKFRYNERKPEDGKVLTQKGWRRV